MADAAAARREARRKRILENSQNRLQLISGKKSIEETSRASPCTFSSPEESSDVSVSTSSATPCYQPESNGTILAGITQTHTSSTSSLLESLATQDAEAAGDTEILNDLTSFMSTPPRTEKESSTWDKLMTYKYDVALLVVIKQLLFFLFSYDSAFFFVPLAVYTATRLIWFPTEKKSQIADVFLLMNGMSANRVQKVTFAMQILKEISLDICVYLFVTICIESLLVFLSSTIFI